MKVLMQARYDLFDIKGGDTVQIESTAAELRKLGIEVDITTSLKTDLSDYSVVHLFQLDWVPETYLYAKKNEDSDKPFILSPIHHSIKEVERFDEEYTFGLRRFSKMLFRKQEHRDTLKNVYRSFYDFRKLRPTIVSVLKGLRNMQRDTLRFADIVLVQTDLEAQDLSEVYDVDFDWIKIPNGVGSQFIWERDYIPAVESKDYILCVGRIEARKNQLSVIEAVKNLREKGDIRTDLVFVGNKSRHHGEYVRKFDSLAKKYDWIRCIGSVPYEDMPSLYHFSKVCVSASWFESTGLTSLEALFCGSNVVASGDRAKEYLGEYASYCSPDDVSSIEAAITSEYLADRPFIPSEMRSEYTWENAAKKTKEVYERVLKS